MAFNPNAPNSPPYEVATIIDPPYVMEKGDGSGQYEGLVVDLLDRVADKANFRYRLKVLPGFYGHQQPQGNWTGLIGSLATLPAQMAVGAIAVSPARSRVVQFTETFHSSSIQLLLPRPTPEPGPGAGLLLAPLTASAWILICLAFVLVSLGLYLIGRFSPREWTQVPAERDMRRARHSFGLRNSFLFTISTLTWQGYREAPKSLSGRVLAVSWWFFVAMVLAAYLSNLTALVSSRPHLVASLSFRHYQDILRDRAIDVAMIRNGDADLQLSSSEDTLEKQLYEYVSNRHGWVDSLDEGLRQLRQSGGGLAMLLPSYKARYLTSRHCDLIRTGHGLDTVHYAFAFPASSRDEPLRRRVNASILEMRETGALKSLIKIWDSNGSHCPDPEGNSLPVRRLEEGGALSFLAIGPVDLAVPFLLLFVGGLVSAAVVAWEVLHAKAVLKQSKKDKAPPEASEPLTSKPSPALQAQSNSVNQGKEEDTGAAEGEDAVEAESSKDLQVESKDNNDGGTETNPYEEIE